MDATTRSRVAREEWAKRIERWRESGLTATEFAAEIGVNPRTLTYWKWMLGKESRGEKRTWSPRRRAPKQGESPASATAASNASLIELQAVRTTSVDARFELELRNGRRLRLGSDFDADGLRRLVSILEAP